MIRLGRGPPAAPQNLLGDLGVRMGKGGTGIWRGGTQSSAAFNFAFATWMGEGCGFRGPFLGGFGGPGGVRGSRGFGGLWGWGLWGVWGGREGLEGNFGGSRGDLGWTLWGGFGGPAAVWGHRRDLGGFWGNLGDWRS